jgi:hypothetical protein
MQVARNFAAQCNRRAPNNGLRIILRTTERAFLVIGFPGNGRLIDVALATKRFNGQRPGLQAKGPNQTKNARQYGCRTSVNVAAMSSGNYTLGLKLGFVLCNPMRCKDI